MSRAGGRPGPLRRQGWWGGTGRTRGPHGGAGAPGKGQAVGGGDGGIGGAGEKPPGAAGGEQHGVGSQLRAPPARYATPATRVASERAAGPTGLHQTSGSRQGGHGDQRAGLHPEPAAAGTIQDGAFQDGGDEPARDAGAGRVPTGVQDARRRVRRFQAQGGSAVGVRVEMHAVAAQAGDVPDGFGAQDADCLGVVQPGTGGERVCDVGRHGVPGSGIPRCQHGGDAALGVEGVALLQRPLAEQDHLDVTAGGGVGGEQRGVESRNAAADNHEPPGHGRAASMRSSATFAGAATSSSTVMRLSTSPRTSASRTQAR